MRQIPTLLLWSGRVALALYFALAALILIGRYWVLPTIDQWRPLIEQKLSGALGSQVTLGQVSANWKGLNPSLDLSDIVVKNPAGQPVFSLPRVAAQLAWSSLMRGEIRFTTLQAQGLELDVRRDAQGKIWLMGQPLETGADTQTAATSRHPLAAWLLEQDHIVIEDAGLRWRDEMRDAPALVLDDIDIQFVRDAQGYRASLQLKAPAALAGTLDLAAQLAYVDTSLELTDPDAWSGLLYLSMDDVQPRAWSPWVDFPQLLVKGKMAGQWWVDFGAGRAPVVTSRTVINQGVFQFGAAQSSRAQVEDFSVDASGSWPAFKAVFEALGTPQQRPVPVSPEEAVQWRLRSSQASLVLPEVFEAPLGLDHLELDASTYRDAQDRLVLKVQQAQVISAALDLVMQGQWQAEPGTSGRADFQGLMRRATLGQIGSHLPVTVDADAREWLARGLPEGQLRNASVVLTGELDHFPFGEQPDKGTFRIAGRFEGTDIDYAPPVAAGEPNWPRLTAAAGVVALDKVDLRLFADQATVMPEPGRSIILTSVKAHIPNIETEAILTVQGDSKGQAEAYLGLARSSPLGGLLDHALAQSSADGEWTVPLKLRVPLMDTDATTVQGEIHFDGGAVVIDPDVPRLSNVRGHLSFSDTGLDTRTLTASFLGGPLALKGGIGKGRPGLSLQGRLTGQALAEFVDLKGMRRLAGRTDYTATVQRLPTRRYVMSLQSDLAGLGADFPMPVGKTEREVLPLRADWVPGNDALTARLDVSLGADVRVRLARRPEPASQAWFDAVAIGVRQTPLVPARGLSIDARYPAVDADAWLAIVDEFEEPLAAGAGNNRPKSGTRTPAKLPLLPSMRQLRVQSDAFSIYGLALDQATLSASQQVPGQWRIDINSLQTAGVLRWNEARPNQPEFIEGRFERLALGSAQDDDAAPATDTSTSASDTTSRFDDFDIPALKLDVRQFTLYGRALGELSVTGINVAEGKAWKLENLSLLNESARLAGTGLWQLDGGSRGLTLDAQVKVIDLGGLLTRLGHKDAVSGGAGSIGGQLRWGNMPWQFERSDISGKLDVDLKKGRFSSVNSRSAKVLELLSFQSIQRILSFDLSPEGMFREGYPFDALGGSLLIERGIMSTKNFNVDGPVGRITLGGNVNLVDETLGLTATVAPNLDMSGAALAGMVINPIVGVGAFLTQWLLKAPLSRAMTLSYQVTGKLDDPKLTEVAAQTKSAENNAQGREGTTTP
ncbi:MAG: TIGR02099 family protein [Alcaligenaceae bacterium]|nr:TIGR02099 family protein [Alcaligenaceae bacterium]